MITISAALKEQLVQKVLTRGAQTIESIAKGNNVSYSSLQKWTRLYREGQLQTTATIQATHLSRAERFHHLIQSAGLDEAALGAYCRAQGLYSHQLLAWKQEMTSDMTLHDKTPSLELKALRAENKALKKELYRKEKALAEAAALLVLKKKAHLIWGAPEDD